MSVADNRLVDDRVALSVTSVVGRDTLLVTARMERVVVAAEVAEETMGAGNILNTTCINLCLVLALGVARWRSDRCRTCDQ